MSDIVTIAQLEALRTSVLGLVTTAQGVLMHIESMVLAGDHTEPNAPDWGTFDDATEPTKEHNNGRQGKRR